MAQFKYKQLSQDQQDKLDAAAFRRLLAHLNDHKEVA
ncbi:deoxycytidine triphosphate deaminase, partial [Vibrio parahaemolyticus]